MRVLKYALILLLILSLLVLFGCGSASDPGTGPQESRNTGTETETPVPQITLAENGRCDYTVVRPDDNDRVTTSGAVSVMNALSFLSGTKVKICTDYDPKDLTEREILVGNTNRPESAEASGRLGEEDYRIEVNGTKIAIVGKSDAGLAEGVAVFLQDVLGFYSKYDYVQKEAYTVDENAVITGKVDTIVKDPRNENDVLIYTASVTEYGAAGDGSADATVAFQSALNAVRDQGGGTVYVPAGQYLIKGSLTVGRSVYLVGSGGPGHGSVLLATGNAGSEDRAKSLITLGASAGVIGLTVYYPDQKPDAVKAYPPAIRIKDNLAGDASQHASYVEKVVLVNPYVGISADEGLQLPTLTDVRMSALSVGFRINQCYDCARITSLYVTPKIWSEYSGISEDTVSGAMRSSLTGLVLSRTDMQMMHDVKLDSCKTGVYLSRDKSSSGETAGYTDISEIFITRSVTGVYSEYNSCSFSGGQISVSGKDAVCVRLGEEAPNESALRFYDILFENPDGNCLEIEGGAGGILAVQNSEFRTWKSGSLAVTADGGILSVTDCDFKGSGRAIQIGSDTRGAAVSGNRFADAADPVNCELRAESCTIQTGSGTPGKTDTFELKLDPAPVVYTSASVYNVKDYGAVGNGSTDCLQAFRTALSEAGKTGGIVYVPAGHYLVSGPLVIPTGVELRGISEGLHVSSGEGSVLLVTAGEDDPDGEAFITMSRSSALRGVMFWYPGQAWNALKTYPFTVRVNGQDCVIRNICLGNTYRGIDMGSADCGGHYVENITGCVLETGIVLDGSTKGGTIRNTHFNLTFYTNLSRNSTLKDSSGVGGNDMFVGLLNLLNANLTAYRFGSTVDEQLLFVFNYRARYGMVFTGGFDGTIVGSAVDGSLCGLKVTGSYEKPLTFLAFLDDIVPGTTPEGNLAVYVETDDKSEVRMISSGASSYNYVPEGLVRVVTGSLVLNGFDARVTPASGKGAVRVERGYAELSGIVFQHVGTLDAAGAFTRQAKTPTTIDIYVGSKGSASIGSAIGVDFLNTDLAGSVSPKNTAYTKS